jgi:hypothetical protein
VEALVFRAREELPKTVLCEKPVNQVLRAPQEGLVPFAREQAIDARCEPPPATD